MSNPHESMTMPDASAGQPAPSPSFAEALRFWLKLGCISFGGPAGQIAIMQTELVDKRHWIDQRAFLRGLNFATLLPGPEAMQLATYIGWRLHGTWGGVISGTLFVLPGAALLLLLSWIAAAHGDTRAVAAVFDGLKPVVIAIIIGAVWRIGRRALKTWQAAALAAAAFIAIYVLGIDFPWIVLAAGAIGWLSGRNSTSPFVSGSHGDDVGAALAAPAGEGGARRAAIITAAFIALWAVPVVACVFAFGRVPFGDIANLFTKAAFVTFGGAYAVLPYVAEEAVRTYAWLSPADMLNGLALAETTPGPLILVLEYVGFFAGWNNAVALSPALAGTIGAALATYVTFLPSFLFILVAAPYIEGLHDNKAISAALGAITAAVVGVILNLGVFLAGAVFFPAPGAVDWISVAAAVAAGAALLRFQVDIHWLVAAGAVFGLARMAFGV